MASNSSDSGGSLCYKWTSLEPEPFRHLQEFIFVLYFSTSVVSIVGNVIVIVVQIFGRESSRSLRQYLINLAASDITLSVMSSPFTYTNIVLGHWPYPRWLCPTAQFAQLLSVFITSATLTLIGIERYLVTLHPLSRAAQWLRSHSTSLLLLFWLIGALYAYFPTANTHTAQFKLNGLTYYQCTYYRSQQSLRNLQIFIVINFCFTFLLPLGIITFSYVAIIRRVAECNHFVTVHIRREHSIGYKCESNANTNSASAENRSKTIKIMLAVILVYIFCWLPVKVFQFLRSYGVINFCTKTEFYLIFYLYLGFHWLAMASSFCNPILYSYYSKSFRNDFWRIIYSCLFTRLHSSEL